MSALALGQLVRHFGQKQQRGAAVKSVTAIRRLRFIDGPHSEVGGGQCPLKEGHPISAKALAARHGVPLRHLKMLLQSLVRDGILKGIRGHGAGMSLHRSVTASP